MARVDRLGDLALDLDAEVVGEHDVCAPLALVASPIASAAGSAGAVGCVSRP